MGDTIRHDDGEHVPVTTTGGVLRHRWGSTSGKLPRAACGRLVAYASPTSSPMVDTARACPECYAVVDVDGITGGELVLAVTFAVPVEALDVEASGRTTVELELVDGTTWILPASARFTIAREASVCFPHDRTSRRELRTRPHDWGGEAVTLADDGEHTVHAFAYWRSPPVWPRHADDEGTPGRLVVDVTVTNADRHAGACGSWPCACRVARFVSPPFPSPSSWELVGAGRWVAHVANLPDDLPGRELVATVASLAIARATDT